MEIPTSLRERIESTVRRGTLRTTEFGSCDWSWLDHPEHCDEAAWRLHWLKEAGIESEADGFKDGAEALFELAAVIADELSALGRH